MNEKISLRQTERRVYAAATQDGLTDILIGCIASMLAIAPLLSETLGDFWSSVVFLPFWGLVWLGIWWVRRQVVRPRLGSVRFGAARKARLRRFTWLMMVLNIIALAAGLWFAFHAEPSSGFITSVIFGVLCLMFLSTAGYFLDFPRLYIYGLLTGLSPLVGEWLWSRGAVSHHGFPVTFGVSSAVMILTGLVVFVRLLRNNPAPASGSPAEEV